MKNAQPGDKTYQPKADAMYVLELQAGSVERSAIKVGMEAKFDYTAKGDSS